MIIFAVDPGPLQSAFVAWDGERIHHAGKLPNDEVLVLPVKWADSNWRYVIEMINAQGMEIGQTTIETIFWIGRFYERWPNCDRITRRDVKLHMCGSSRAKDKNVRQAVIDRLGPPGTKLCRGVTYGIAGDEWQALALALTWWELHD